MSVAAGALATAGARAPASGAGTSRAPLARVVLLLAAAKLLLHLLTTGRFGYEFFVDELYFLSCSEHLAWGYIDMPPLTAALAALARGTLGDSLLALRLVPALAGAGLVLLAGALARELGGGRLAQGLAALAVIVAPIFLILHSFHSMNAVEPLLWTGGALVVARIANGASGRGWLLFGLLAGIGLLNKHTMALFGAGIAAGLLATPARRAFRERWIWIAALLAFAIFLPNLVWMARRGFPHLEMLANIREDRRDVVLGPLGFLAQQVLFVHPLALPLWLGGLGWLLFARGGARHRPLGIAFLVVIGVLIAVRGRAYYPAPAYPMLLAAGGVAFERWLAAPRGAWARAARVAYPATLALAGAALAPIGLPCLPPETYIRYTRAIHLEQPRIETHDLGPLPQLFADRFGWREMAEVVARAYHALPPEERARAAIFGQNYGQAGAIDHYGPALGLPKCLSGHLAFHDWGPRGATGEVMIVLGDERDVLEEYFEEVEWAGRVEHPYSMPYQHFDLFVCRGLRAPLAEVWPRLRQWD